jgi:hypothetical protein
MVYSLSSFVFFFFLVLFHLSHLLFSLILHLTSSAWLPVQPYHSCLPARETLTLSLISAQNGPQGTQIHFQPLPLLVPNS